MMPGGSNVLQRGTKPKTGRPFFRRGLALWIIQTLLLASATLILRFCDASWVDLCERQRLARNFMANPVEMIIVEVFGTLCILIGISGLRDNNGSSLDVVWAGYMPLFVGVCLTPAVHGRSFSTLADLQMRDSD